MLPLVAYAIMSERELLAVADVGVEIEVELFAIGVVVCVDGVF